MELGVTKDLNKSIMMQLDTASTCNTLPDKIAQLLILLGQTFHSKATLFAYDNT